MNIKNVEVKKINKRLRKNMRELKGALGVHYRTEFSHYCTLNPGVVQHGKSEARSLVVQRHIKMAYLLSIHEAAERVIRLKTRSFKGKAIGITNIYGKVKCEFKTKVLKSYGQVQNITT